MNIFHLDTNLIKSAEYHCNKHVVKLIVEATQLACTAHRFYNTQDFPNKFYKSTHVNHPLSKWVQVSIENYMYCVDYGLALCAEYTFRYGKTHATESLLKWLKQNIPNMNAVYFTDPPQCMPDQFKVKNNIIQAYRNYYKYKQQIIDFRYTKRGIPQWLI